MTLSLTSNNCRRPSVSISRDVEGNLIGTWSNCNTLALTFDGFPFPITLPSLSTWKALQPFGLQDGTHTATITGTNQNGPVSASLATLIGNPPTYAVVPNALTVTAGNSVEFKVTTTSLPLETPLHWIALGLEGTTTSEGIITVPVPLNTDWPYFQLDLLTDTDRWVATSVEVLIIHDLVTRTLVGWNPWLLTATDTEIWSIDHNGAGSPINRISRYNPVTHLVNPVGIYLGSVGKDMLTLEDKVYVTANNSSGTTEVTSGLYCYNFDGTLSWFRYIPRAGKLGTDGNHLYVVGIANLGGTTDYANHFWTINKAGALVDDYIFSKYGSEGGLAIYFKARAMSVYNGTAYVVTDNPTQVGKLYRIALTGYTCVRSDLNIIPRGNSYGDNPQFLEAYNNRLLFTADIQVQAVINANLTGTAINQQIDHIFPNNHRVTGLNYLPEIDKLVLTYGSYFAEPSGIIVMDPDTLAITTSKDLHSAYPTNGVELNRTLYVASQNRMDEIHLPIIGTHLTPLYIGSTAVELTNGEPLYITVPDG